MQLLAAIPIAVFLTVGDAFAQPGPNAPGPTTTNSTPALANEGDEKVWSFSVSAYAYLVRDSREYVQPTVLADRDWLHLEGRYNYEALNTGSIWAGYNFGGGEKLAWEFTPMLGGVFGDTTGMAPGYKGALRWWKLELASEGEYVLDTASTSDSFFYTWSELSFAPVDWFRFGAAVQRSKLYKTDFDVQRGFLVGVSFRRIHLTTYVFNPDDKPTFVFAISLDLK